MNPIRFWLIFSALCLVATLIFCTCSFAAHRANHRAKRSVHLPPAPTARHKTRNVPLNDLRCHQHDHIPHDHILCRETGHPTNSSIFHELHCILWRDRRPSKLITPKAVEIITRDGGKVFVQEPVIVKIGDGYQEELIKK